MSEKTLGKIKKTSRGFEFIEFKDYNGDPCSLQQSSLAIYQQPGSSAIWLGQDSSPDIGPGRMHLNRDQVKKLITSLERWLAHGSFRPVK